MSSIVRHLLPSPEELETLYPIDSDTAAWLQASRRTAAQIIVSQEERIALIVGPCSIHNPDEALEFAARLRRLQREVEDRFFLIMRVFLEKPRTKIGWKGLLYDPYLDGSNDLNYGLRLGRKLLVELSAMRVPCATEFLDPLICLYLSGLITWGMIGARTSASQPHRQLASGLPFPIGFKNSVDGDLEMPISGIAAARTSHTHFSLDPAGRIASIQTTGNPLVHLVLRGSDAKPNCDFQSVARALEALRAHHLEERLVIDCAHGNSGKDLERQRLAFQDCIGQILEKNGAIRGLMLESQLCRGKQPLGDEPQQLQYGLSITDPCLGWEETEELILAAADRFRSALSKSDVSRSLKSALPCS